MATKKPIAKSPRTIHGLHSSERKLRLVAAGKWQDYVERRAVLHATMGQASGTKAADEEFAEWIIGEKTEALMKPLKAASSESALTRAREAEGRQDRKTFFCIPLADPDAFVGKEDQTNLDAATWAIQKCGTAIKPEDAPSERAWGYWFAMHDESNRMMPQAIGAAVREILAAEFRRRDQRDIDLMDKDILEQIDRVQSDLDELAAAAEAEVA